MVSRPLPPSLPLHSPPSQPPLLTLLALCDSFIWRLGCALLSRARADPCVLLRPLFAVADAAKFIVCA